MSCLDGLAVPWFPWIAVVGALHNYKTIFNISIAASGENANCAETLSKEVPLNSTRTVTTPQQGSDGTLAEKTPLSLINCEWHLVHILLTGSGVPLLGGSRAHTPSAITGDKVPFTDPGDGAWAEKLKDWSRIMTVSVGILFPQGWSLGSLL